jgi:hypothetical protein
MESDVALARSERDRDQCVGDLSTWITDTVITCVHVCMRREGAKRGDEGRAYVKGRPNRVTPCEEGEEGRVVIEVALHSHALRCTERQFATPLSTYPSSRIIHTCT